MIRFIEHLRGCTHVLTWIYQANKVRQKKQKKKIDVFASPNIKKEYIPDDLQRHADLIVEWWPIRHKKKATCSEKVAQRIFKTLRSFTLDEQIRALEMAIIGGYKDVYKPNDKIFFKKEEPVVNHPASKVFKASEQNWPNLNIVNELSYKDDGKISWYWFTCKNLKSGIT